MILRVSRTLVRSPPVLDLLYISGTILFFALALLYVHGCAALGQHHDADTTAERADAERSR